MRYVPTIVGRLATTNAEFVLFLVQLEVCHHYPPADQEPAKTYMAKFLWPEDHHNVHSRLLLGNGASELIDLVTRAAPEGPWKPGPWNVQVCVATASTVRLVTSSGSLEFGFSIKNMRDLPLPLAEQFFAPITQHLHRLRALSIPTIQRATTCQLMS